MIRPEVLRVGVLDIQVCVPLKWTDKEIIQFTNLENPSGTSNGWEIRKQGSKWLAGDDERVK
jgi:hypothetical protein